MKKEHTKEVATIKYQIRFCDKNGNGSFQYVDVKSRKGVEKKAAEKATEYINKQKEVRGNFGFFINSFKPKRVVHVWEWDTEKGEPKRGGHRFKLELMFIQATYTTGRKMRNEWYEPIEVTPKEK